MACLGAKNYDPTTAVTKGTAASAMAAFDTANARIAFVVPSSGRVWWRVKCTLHGATTMSQVLLGIMEGAAVKTKQSASAAPQGNLAATTLVPLEASGVIEGLTPGAALTYDAAWGIETFVASSLIKYGGPANATANNDFGALVFEIWEA